MRLKHIGLVLLSAFGAGAILGPLSLRAATGHAFMLPTLGVPAIAGLVALGEALLLLRCMNHSTRSLQEELVQALGMVFLFTIAVFAGVYVVSGQCVGNPWREALGDATGAARSLFLAGCPLVIAVLGLLRCRRPSQLSGP